MQDFLGNCDKVVFGVDRSDVKVMEMLKKALGSYTDKETDLSGNVRTVTKELMPESEIASFMNAKRKGQFFIPVKGLPMKLKRAHYDSNFWEHKRGGIFDRYKRAKANIIDI